MKNQAILDKRFAHVLQDPRYKNHRKNKIKIGKEFSRAMKNSSVNTFDPRGRKYSYGSNAELLKFYNLSSEDDSEEEGNLDNIAPTLSEDALKTRYENMDIDYLRGEGDFPDDSSDGESSQSSEDDEIELEEENDIYESENNPIEETRRIAMCRFNWECIKVQDIMAIINSFTPPTGSVKKVSLYLSKIGKERLEEEDKSGPSYLKNLRKKQKNRPNVSESEGQSNSEEEENENENKYEKAAVRKYMSDRLLYYYAVIECDSVETAAVIYQECDNTALFENSDVNIDLRYISDNTDFEEDPVEVCSSVPESYSFTNFENNIATANLNMQWDETNTVRQKILEKAAKNASRREPVDLDALEQFVGSGSSSEDDEKDEKRRTLKEKIKKLLKKIDDDQEFNSDSDVELDENIESSDEEKSNKTANDKKKSKSKKRKKNPDSDDENSDEINNELSLLVDQPGTHTVVENDEINKKEKLNNKAYGILKRKEKKSRKNSTENSNYNDDSRFNHRS